MKVCSKCNSQVADDLSFCPSCGNKMDGGVEPSIEPNNAPAPAAPSVEPVQSAPETPVQSAPETPAQQANAPVAAPAGGNGGKVAIIIVLVVVVLLLLGVCVFFAIKALGSNGESGEPTSGEVGPSTVSDAKNSAKYNGFEFTLPDGYQTEEDAKYGIMIYNDNLAFSILEDSTNSFNDYYNEFAAEYPTQADKLVSEVGGHKYILIALTDEAGETFGEYIYDSNEGYLFVGILMNSSFTTPTTDELNILHGVLTSAKRSSSFAPGDGVDSGKNGLVKFKDKFDFK